MSLVDLFVVILLIGIPTFVATKATKLYGFGAGSSLGFVTLIVCGILACLFYRKLSILAVARRENFRERYKRIYRVLALPHDSKSIVATGAEIRVGDIGWEAEPYRHDGLVYLQGLTEDWYVVWYAGFDQSQIELVGLKSQSQYDWYDLVHNSKIVCPFPLSSDRTVGIGRAN